ncbi:hypothetical protein SDJN02_27154, partial [Cucurbita argyrosperma subsp. argyrosperma]
MYRLTIFLSSWAVYLDHRFLLPFASNRARFLGDLSSREMGKDGFQVHRWVEIDVSARAACGDPITKHGFNGTHLS